MTVTILIMSRTIHDRYHHHYGDNDASFCFFIGKVDNSKVDGARNVRNHEFLIAERCVSTETLCKGLSLINENLRWHYTF